MLIPLNETFVAGLERLKKLLPHMVTSAKLLSLILPSNDVKSGNRTSCAPVLNSYVVVNGKD